MASSAAAAPEAAAAASGSQAAAVSAPTDDPHVPTYRGLKRSRGLNLKYISSDEVAVKKEAVDGWEDMSKKQLKRAIRVLQSNKIREIKSERREANKADNDVLFTREPGALRVGFPDTFDYLPFKAILDKPAEERGIKLNASARTRVRMAESMLTAPAVLLDCCPQYEEWMKFSERSSVALQVMHAYSSNRQADKPVWFGISGVSPELDGLLYDLGGHGWAVHCAPQPLSPAAAPPQLGNRKLVYLSAEGETVLDSVQADTAYIVGGLVDRNRHKGAAAQRAKDLGLPTVRLPLQENLGMSDATVLTCLHVVQLLLRVWNGASWAEACQATLPQRKIANKRPRTASSTPDAETDTDSAPAAQAGADTASDTAAAAAAGGGP